MSKKNSDQREQSPVASLGQGTSALNEQHPQKIQMKMQELRQQGHKHLAARHWAQAGESFLRLLDYEPQDEDALQSMAVVFDSVNQFAGLYKMAQRLLEISPNSAHGLAYKARALQKMERFSEATIANDQALLLNTNLGLAWINRSGLQLLQGKLPEALRSSRRAIELAPDDARAWANQGVALTNYNRLSEALESFEQSLALDPQQLFALQMKGEILRRIGRMNDLLVVVSQALHINPDDTTALTQGIQAARAMEMYDRLKELSLRLIKVTPENAFAREHYMRSLRGLGQYEEANEALDQLLLLDSSNALFWTLKADTLYRLERYREAVSAAERAKMIAADYPPALRIYEKSLKLMYQRKDRRKKLR